MANEKTPPLHPLVRLLATGAFLGYSPVAPGTAGALGCAVLLWFILPEVTPASPPLSILALLVSVAAFVLLSVWSADRAESRLGRDASRIVIDEFAGMVITLVLLPKSLFVFGVGFLLFRVLDIVKPFPAGRAESLPGGWGVVMDDVVAGVYANVLLRLMLLVRGG